MKSKGEITVALIGNPNTGKTSLINNLVGLNLHVGNWPGKTVEKKEGRVNFQDKKIKIVDLPGTYCLAPYSEEEKISRDFIISQKPDVIVQIIDVNALERNLLMTFELLSLKRNLLLAFNFNKEAQKRGVKVDIDRIKKRLQIPIIQIEAHIGENKKELLEKIVNLSTTKFKKPSYIDPLIKNRREINHYNSIKFIRENISPFYSTKIIYSLSDRIDSVILNKYTALPIFFLAIYLLLQATFVLSPPIANLIKNLFGWLSGLLEETALPALLKSFLIEGVISGIGTVLTFVPFIFILFLFISLLEDTGYLSRTVVLVDRLFQKVGITGRTFIPMILGFSCNVPAIMATRTIRNRRERLIAIFINPFISCSARLPVFVLFSSIFFPQKAPLVIVILYFSGVVTAFITSLILSKLIKSREESTLIIELPPYRLPRLKNILRTVWFQTSQFIKRAGTIILVAVMIIWVFASLPLGVEYGSEESLIGKIGQLLVPIFRPLGFGNWMFIVSLIFGFVAKELIIGTLGTLHRVGEGTLPFALSANISSLGALSFLFFVLLYVPCLATVAIMKRESGSWKFVVAQVMTSTTIAWLVAFLVYNFGLLLGIFNF